MDYKETKKLMEDIAKERRATLRPEEIKKLDEAMAASERFVAEYKRVEDAEDAWTSYQLALSKPEYDALRSDHSKYWALSGLFFGARDPEKLEQYASMTVDELAQLAADNDAAAFAKMDAAEYAEAVASLEAADPARLAAALASLQKMRQKP